MIRSLGHREIATLATAGAQIVDVLPRREFETTHIVGALHLPLRSLMKNALRLLDPGRPVIVYCRDNL